MKIQFRKTILLGAVLMFMGVWFGSCAKETCLQCSVVVGVFPNGNFDFESLTFCEDDGLIFMGTTYPTITELRLAITSMGGKDCATFTQ